MLKVAPCAVVRAINNSTFRKEREKSKGAGNIRNIYALMGYKEGFVTQCQFFTILKKNFPYIFSLFSQTRLCTYHRPSAGGGGGTPGKGGDFVKDPVKVLIFPLLGGDTEESKFPSLRGITLSSLKPDKKTVLYTLNEMSCFNSAYMFVTMQISMYC